MPSICQGSVNYEIEYSDPMAQVRYPGDRVRYPGDQVRYLGDQAGNQVRYPARWPGQISRWPGQQLAGMGVATTAHMACIGEVWMHSTCAMNELHNMNALSTTIYTTPWKWISFPPNDWWAELFKNVTTMHYLPPHFHQYSGGRGRGDKGGQTN